MRGFGGRSDCPAASTPRWGHIHQQKKGQRHSGRDRQAQPAASTIPPPCLQPCAHFVSILVGQKWLRSLPQSALSPLQCMDLHPSRFIPASLAMGCLMPQDGAPRAAGPAPIPATRGQREVLAEPGTRGPAAPRGKRHSRAPRLCAPPHLLREHSCSSARPGSPPFCASPFHHHLVCLRSTKTIKSCLPTRRALAPARDGGHTAQNRLSRAFPALGAACHSSKPHGL